MTSPDASTTTPFVIQLLRLDEKPDGSFFPGAVLTLTPLLRTSGLLRELPGDETKSLLMLLTFLSANGDCLASVVELAAAFRLSSVRTQARMRRLAAFRWQGKPLVRELRRPSGLDAFALSPHLVAVKQALPGLPSPSAPQRTYRASGREAVIAHSRAAYARPREEVEREIARLNGWQWPPVSPAQTREELRREAQEDANTPTVRQNSAAEPSSSLTSTAMSATPSQEEIADLRHLLTAWGLTYDQADSLLLRFDAEHIRRQIEWMPLRHANSPARFLIAAILHDYEAPYAARQEPYSAEEAETVLPTPQNNPEPTDDNLPHP